MEQMRKPFQGVINIIRFNWHFYVGALFFVLVLFCTSNYYENPNSKFINIFSVLVLIAIIISLVVSYYVYDFSNLYHLNWIEYNNQEKQVVNIHAGFDETSYLLQSKFPKAELLVLDFYDPKKHTEVSIKRARKAYPPFPKTKQISTYNLALANNSVDKIFVIFSAHEIRNEMERITFFKELNRVINSTGKIYITEHLRNLPNFLAYNIGFFHFYSKSSWLKTFNNARLKIEQEIKLTPFITTFKLHKNGNTL